jgi:hypothetical protein
MNNQRRRQAMRMNKEDILEALGIESGNSWLTHGLAGFGIGCAVGAVVAMLLAPKSGAELRSTLAERGRDLMNRNNETAGKNPTTNY